MDCKFGQITGFDDDRGMLTLSQGSSCWDDMRDAFTSMAEWMDEQLAMMKETDMGQVEDIKEVVIEMEEEVEDDEGEETKTETEKESIGIESMIETVQDYTDY